MISLLKTTNDIGRIYFAPFNKKYVGKNFVQFICSQRKGLILKLSLLPAYPLRTSIQKEVLAMSMVRRILYLEESVCSVSELALH